MKRVFTKKISPLLLTFVAWALALTAQAQTFTETLAPSGTNDRVTALTTDKDGNVWAIVDPSGGTTSLLVEYVAATGSPVQKDSGIPINDGTDGATIASLASDSHGNIYVSTNNPGTSALIYKYTASSSYSRSTLVTGSDNIGYFEGMNVGPDDNLYVIQYNANGNTAGAGLGDFEVARYPTTSVSVNTATVGGTPLYTDLDHGFFAGGASDNYSHIVGIQVDASLNIYVADGFDENQVQTATNGQNIYKLLKPGSGNNYTLGGSVAANLHATALAMNTARTNLYASVSLTHTSTYSVVEFVGGTGSPITLYTGLTDGGVNYPFGIAYVSDSELYVGDGLVNSSNTNDLEIIYGTPATQASNVSFSSIATTTATASWTNGGGSTRAVFINQTSSTSSTPSPANNTAYTAAVGAYTNGTQAGSGWYCVYNGTGTTTSISGLASGTAYRVAVVEYNGTTGSQNYLTTAGTGNPANFTTLTPTITAPGGTVTVTATTTGTAGSSVSFNISGANLSGNLTATAPTNFQVSSDNSSWNTTATITQSGGTITNAPVYVRLSGSGSVGTQSGNVALSGGGATTVNQAVSGSLNSPSTTISSLTAVTSTTTNAASVQYTATFAASISGLSTSDFTLNTTGVSGASVSSVTGSGTSWTVTVNTGSGDGTVQLVMNSSSGVTPSVSNLPLSGSTYTIDKTAPSVSSIIATTPSNATTTNASSVIYTVTFSEAVTGVDATDFALTTSGTSGTVSGVSGSGTSYAVTVSSITGTGTLRLDLKSSGTGITDGSGNAISGGFTSGNVYTIDRTAPTVSSIALAGSSPTNATSVAYTVTFSEPVTGVTSGAFGLVTTSGNATGAINSVTSVSTSVYTVNVTGVSGNGGLRLDLTNVSGISDLNGNPLGSGFIGSVYTIDSTPATLTSGSYFSNNGFSSQYAKVGDVLTLSVGYDEQLQSATMTIGGNSVPVSFSNNNQNFTGTYTMTSSDAEGNVGWTLSATDLAGNVRNYTNNDFGTVLIFDKTRPAISISAPSQANANSASTVNYTVSYSDANFNFSSLGPGDITLNTTGNATGTVAVSGSGTSYTVTISSITGEGTIGFSIGAGTAQDIPGNTALASSASATFTVDETPPTAVSLVYKSNNANQLIAIPGNTVSLTFTTSEPIQTPTVTIGGNAIVATNTSGNDWIASYTVTSADPVGRIHFSTTITDFAGNSTPYDDIAAGDDVERVSADASLSNLTLTTGFVKHPTDFVSTTFNYASFVGAAISTDMVTPTSTDPNATITVNGQAVASGSPSQSISLGFGTTLVTIVVTAQDGSTMQTYTDTIHRALSTNSNLLSLKTNHGVLTPGFSNSTFSYTKAVANNISTINFTATTVDANATILVNGVSTASGSASADQPLSIGDNVVDVKVTAQDGSSKTFEVTVTRAKSSNDKLYTITSSRGTLTRTAPGATTFTKNVNYSFSTINFTVTPVDAGATITVAGSPTASGTPSADQPLAVGDNVIDIVITAADGVTSQTYSVTVTRAPASMNTVYQPIGVTGPETNGLQASADGIKVHEGVSPNADGVNDFLLIEGINNHPDNKLQIMNRSGQLIFEAKGYDNSTKVFDGHSNKNGQMQLPGTYFYSLDYTDKGETKHKTGFIVLKY